MPAETKNEIGRRLKLARKRAKLSLRKVCEMTPGLEVSALSNYEHGRRMPNPDHIKHLSAIYKEPAGYLMTFEDSPANQAEVELLRKYRRLVDARSRLRIERTMDMELDMSAHPPMLPPP